MQRAFTPRKPRDYESSQGATARAIDEAGGVKRVAALLDVSPTAVAAWTDPTIGKSVSYAKARMLTAAGATAFAVDLAGLAGGVFLPVAAHEQSLLSLTAQSARRHGELVGQILAALEDGAIDAKERAALLPKIHELIAGLGMAAAKIGSGE